MTQYIDKSDIVAKIEEWRNNIKKNILSIPLSGKDKAYATYEYEILGKVTTFLDTLEVKEVDYNNTIIERACELLARMIWEVTYEDFEGNSVQHYDKMEFIEDFKKYMKGEEL